MPVDVAEDVVPHVLLQYDLPNLKRTLGSRLAAMDWLDSTQDLSQTSTLLRTLERGER